MLACCSFIISLPTSNSVSIHFNPPQGVGIIELTEGGKMGKLVDVLRATNTVTDSVTVAPGGGHSYSGSERGDVHRATVVANGW